MKNQNDIIGIIVAVLIAAIGIGVIFATKPADKPKETVTPIVTEDVDTPAMSVQMVNSLPGGGASSAGGGSGMGGSMPGMPGMSGRGGPMGPMGPMGPGGRGGIGGAPMAPMMGPMGPGGPGASPMAGAEGGGKADK